MTEALPWAGPFQRRCLARMAEGHRCELRRGHDPKIPHAREYGVADLRWTEVEHFGPAKVRHPIPRAAAYPEPPPAPSG